VYFASGCVSLERGALVFFLSLVPFRYRPKVDGIWDVRYPTLLSPTCLICNQCCKQANSSRSPLLNPLLKCLPLCLRFVHPLRSSTSVMPPRRVSPFVRLFVRSISALQLFRFCLGGLWCEFFFLSRGRLSVLLGERGVYST
jgi:hypothetical protein